MQIRRGLIVQFPEIPVPYHVEELRSSLGRRFQVSHLYTHERLSVNSILRIYQLKPFETEQECIFQIHLSRCFRQRHSAHCHFPSWFSELERIRHAILEVIGLIGREFRGASITQQLYVKFTHGFASTSFLFKSRTCLANLSNAPRFYPLCV